MTRTAAKSAHSPWTPLVKKYGGQIQQYNDWAWYTGQNSRHLIYVSDVVDGYEIIVGGVELKAATLPAAIKLIGQTMKLLQAGGLITFGPGTGTLPASAEG